MAEALVDTNVIVAALVGNHPHHAPSALLLNDESRTFAVAAHSVAEAYNTLTRRGGGAPYRWSPADAWASLEQVAAATTLVGLTSKQTLDAVRRYAESGGVGPRLYDHLIGEVAVRAGLRRIVTWNATDLRGLLPELEVVAPEGARG